MAGLAVEDARYWAFISYSHKDASVGRKLHRRLEGYTVPRRLVGRETTRGLVPRRLLPIFRDREELSAAGDLSIEVQAALRASRSLVVICSPATAASVWVEREVQMFRALYPERPVLAAIVEGEPPACFPSVLYGPKRAEGEPLAADFRPHRDGSQLALLKLVAGILGLRLDEVVQRDAQRKMRRVTAITGITLATMIVMAALTVVALRSRVEALRERGQAEGLVEFMLTDLRDKLRGVGRLDIMGEVNARALNYYAGQDLANLPEDSLERRARILHAMGEDEESRGDYESAAIKFLEARRITAELLSQSPNDTGRIFAHAQSEYWIGYSDYQRNRPAAARLAFQRYKALADRLIALAPSSTRNRQEEAYALGNLCAIARNKPADPKQAVDLCGRALAIMERANASPDVEHRTANAIEKLRYDLMEAHADLGEAYELNGSQAQAREQRRAEGNILESQLKHDPKNMDLRDTWIALQRALARSEASQGNVAAARLRLRRALAVARTSAALDPSNTSWMRLRVNIQDELAVLSRK